MGSCQISIGANEEEAADYAAEYLELEQLKYEFRLQCCGLSTDGTNTLWYKMVRLRNAMLYEEAVECLDLYAILVEETDPNVYVYLSSVVAHMLQIPDTGIDYGAVVVGYADIPHPMLQIGDIIIAFNGEPCRTINDYIAMKGALTGTDYTVTVLRPNGDTLEQVELTLSTQMPLISITSLAMD